VDIQHGARLPDEGNSTIIPLRCTVGGRSRSITPLVVTLPPLANKPMGGVTEAKPFSLRRGSPEDPLRKSIVHRSFRANVGGHYRGGCILNFPNGIDAASLRLEGQGCRGSAPLKIIGFETAYL
jgi:hypothetical protein